MSILDGCIEGIWKRVNAGTHLKRGNTKSRPYEADSGWLVWTAHVYYTLGTNRNKPRLLPRFDVIITDGSVHTTPEAIYSGCCMVHTTRAEATLNASVHLAFSRE